jgi:hypothetical protein
MKNAAVGMTTPLGFHRHLVSIATWFRWSLGFRDHSLPISMTTAADCHDDVC